MILKLLLLLYIIVSFIQGSHTHIPETNHVPRGYIITAILSFLFMVPLCLVPALVLLLLLLLLLFSPWASLGRNQSPVRRTVWLWYAASWASS